MANTITLRSAFGKVKSVWFNPVKDKNGMYPPFVKEVRMNPNGESEMILSEKDLNDPDRAGFIPADMEILVEDGTTFNLDNILERHKWEAIKNSELIVEERGARDEKGNLIIDGDKNRYGRAEFWVEKPGEESARRIKRIQLITKANNFIEQDSAEGRATKVKLLGKRMYNAPDSDIQDFLYQKAEANPNLIIDLYTGQDQQLRLLFIEATDKNIIKKVSGIFMYGDVRLGVNDEAVIFFFKDPANKQILDEIKIQTFPEYKPLINNSETTNKPSSSKN
nr:MAG TPA: hypothetical protein [Caudoviricetes sp.]